MPHEGDPRCAEPLLCNRSPVSPKCSGQGRGLHPSGLGGRRPAMAGCWGLEALALPGRSLSSLFPAGRGPQAHPRGIWRHVTCLVSQVHSCQAARAWFAWRPAPASRAPGPGSCSEPLGDAVCPQPQLPSHRVADPAVASEALRGKKIKRLFLNAHDADGATSAVCFEPASGGGGPDARLLWGSRGQVQGWRVPGKSHAQQERHESNTITE